MSPIHVGLACILWFIVFCNNDTHTVNECFCLDDSNCKK